MMGRIPRRRFVALMAVASTASLLAGFLFASLSSHHEAAGELGTESLLQQREEILLAKGSAQHAALNAKDHHRMHVLAKGMAQALSEGNTALTDHSALQGLQAKVSLLNQKLMTTQKLDMNQQIRQDVEQAVKSEVAQEVKQQVAHDLKAGGVQLKQGSAAASSTHSTASNGVQNSAAANSLMKAKALIAKEKVAKAHPVKAAAPTVGPHSSKAEKALLKARRLMKQLGQKRPALSHSSNSNSNSLSHSPSDSSTYGSGKKLPKALKELEAVEAKHDKQSRFSSWKCHPLTKWAVSFC